MIISQKIELSFNSKEDEELLNRQSKLCVDMYNKMLKYCLKNQSLIFSKYIYGYNLRDLMMEIKRKYPYFYEAHSSPLKNTAFRLRKNLKDFHDHKREMPTPRNFEHNWFSLFYDEPKKGINISGIDMIIALGVIKDKNGKDERMFVHCKLASKIRKCKYVKNYMITRDKNNKYFLIVCMVIESKEDIKIRDNRKCVAIDQNQENFFVSIDNDGVSIQFNKLDFIKPFNETLNKLLIKKENLENKLLLIEKNNNYKESNRNYIGLNQSIKLIKYQRKLEVDTALYCIAKFIVYKYDVIIIGDYLPEPYYMYSKRKEKTDVEDFIIGNFKTVLQYMCNKYNKLFIKINEVNTTKTCHYCGNLVHKGPEIRQFTCPYCNRTYNRDINSAINIGLKSGFFNVKKYVNKELVIPNYILYYDCKDNTIKPKNSDK